MVPEQRRRDGGGRYSGRHGCRYRLLSLLGLVAVLFLTGCAARQWSAPLARQAELRWPGPPHEPKAVYLGSIQAFVPDGKGLLTMLTGRDSEGAIHNPLAVAVGLDQRLAVVDALRQGVHFYRPGEKRYALLRRAGDEEFQTPVGVAFDDDLNLYVSDSSRAKVYVFDSEGRFNRVLRRPLAAGFGGRDDTGFTRPTGLAFANGQLQVVDTGAHRVYRFDGQGRFLGAVGGHGTGDGEFNLPTHLALDPDGRLFVNDAMNFRIQVFDQDGRFLEKFGRHGDGSGDFAMSKGIAVDRWGVVYVVDTLFDNIQLFDQRRRFVLTIGGRGTGEGEFWLPSGIFIDHTDKLWVCDTYNHRLQVFQLLEKRDVVGGP